MLLWKKKKRRFLEKYCLVGTSLSVSMMLPSGRFCRPKANFVVKLNKAKHIQTYPNPKHWDIAQSSHWVGHFPDFRPWTRLQVLHPEQLGTPWHFALSFWSHFWTSVVASFTSAELYCFPTNFQLSTANCSALCIFGLCQYPNLLKLERYSKEEFCMGHSLKMQEEEAKKTHWFCYYFMPI